MAAYFARMLTQPRQPDLSNLPPRELEEAARLIRRFMLTMAAERAERNARCSNAEGQGPSHGTEALGMLLTALGFDAHSDHSAEQELGLGRAVYHKALGL